MIIRRLFRYHKPKSTRCICNKRRIQNVFRRHTLLLVINKNRFHEFYSRIAANSRVQNFGRLANPIWKSSSEEFILRNTRPSRFLWGAQLFENLMNLSNFTVTLEWRFSKKQLCEDTAARPNISSHRVKVVP